MSDLERLQRWLQTYPGAGRLKDYKVDYTDDLPGIFGVFPSGLIEISQKENILGEFTFRNQYNFALYVVLEKSPADDVTAQLNAEWVLDFQRWVQAQSAAHLAPTFGNTEEEKETMSAQNGALYQSDEEGLAMYMIQLQARFSIHA